MLSEKHINSQRNKICKKQTKQKQKQKTKAKKKKEKKEKKQNPYGSA